MTETTYWYVFDEAFKLVYFTTEPKDAILENLDPAFKAKYSIPTRELIPIPVDHYLVYNPISQMITSQPIAISETPPTLNLSGVQHQVVDNQDQIEVIFQKLSAIENMVLQVAGVVNTAFPRDMAVYAGTQADYTFESSTDGKTIVVTNVITSGVDTVTNIETLRFDDGDIGVSLDANGLVLIGSVGASSINIVGDVAVTVLDQEGVDTIIGSAGNDMIDGGPGDDTIKGGAGNDTITGNVRTAVRDGDDTIDGGDGMDIAIFDGNQSEYTFGSSADGLTVTVMDTSTNDVDTLTGVEILRFADGDIGVSRDGTDGHVILTGGLHVTVVGDVGIEVVGSGGDDTIHGGGGDSKIAGGDGDDVIHAEISSVSHDVASNKTIDGGVGTDIIIFLGNQADYTFGSSADGLTTTVARTSSRGHAVNAVTGVETLRFADGDIGVSLDADGLLVLTGDVTVAGLNIHSYSYPVTIVRG